MQGSTHMHNCLRIETEPVHDTTPPPEVPFVPQSMLGDDFQFELPLPPPPARGPRHVQGEIRLPAKVRDVIEQAEKEMASPAQIEDQSPERQGDIIQPQPVESHSPMRHEEGTFIPQLGGGGTRYPVGS